VPDGTGAVKPQPGQKVYVKGKGFLIECAHCGEHAYKKRENARFCSTDCKDTHHKAKKNAKPVQLKFFD
jgi:hypothetical protein